MRGNNNDDGDDGDDGDNNNNKPHMSKDALVAFKQ